ncbi:MAG: biotin/lipoyl-containing protein, partial [Pseudomonadota bacterium]
GGKGMRVAATRDVFVDACDAARREAANAFGDDQLLLEKFIERPRHVEVQVFGDHDGEVVHLFERECSVQRRYQKIIEEAPSPSIDDALRDQMTATAVTAAQAVHYRGAGTIEFIVTPDDAFYFMEMNTRLQVEHPVTEAITGVDLVEWQLRAAAGETMATLLPGGQAALERHGHAIECRIYAEDPFNQFVPSSGRLRTLLTPDDARLDIDLVEGQAVTPFYDPMIAKLTVHANDRADAVTRMTDALNATTIVGPKTNLPLLRTLMRHPDYLDCAIHTAYLDQSLDAVLSTHAEVPLDALAAATFFATADTRGGPSPWAADGWQANGAGQRRLVWTADDGTEHSVCLSRVGTAWQVHDAAGHRAVRRSESGGRIAIDLETDGRTDRRTWQATEIDGGVRVQCAAHAFELTAAPLYPVVRDAATDDRRPGAPMPGRIVKVLVSEGDAVEKGQPLLVMEGMKMELTITAAQAGVVQALHCAAGDQVEADVPLVELDAP